MTKDCYDKPIKKSQFLEKNMWLVNLKDLCIPRR